MDPKQIEKFIAKYSVTSFLTSVIAGIIISGFAWIVSISDTAQHLGANFIDYLLVLSRYVKQTLELAISVLFAIASVDAIFYSLSKRGRFDYKFMTLINSGDKKAYLEIILGNLCLYLFFVVGQLNTWVQEEFYEKMLIQYSQNIIVYIPNYYIVSLLTLSLLCFVAKGTLMYKRK